MYLNLTMSKNAEDITLNLLISSAEDSPVKTSAMQESESELTENEADCGQSSIGLFATYDHDTCSWRTLRHSLVGGLIEFSQTWPPSGTMRNGECFLHVKWDSHIHGKDC